jgi:phosphoserine phosphatase
MERATPPVARMTRFAIFDFDGTILRGNSWHEFFRFELRRRPA